MRSFLAGLRRLVIPWAASGNQPRVVIATDDPLALELGQDAAVVFYWWDGRGFLAAVEDSGGTGNIGQFRIMGRAGLRTAQYIDIDYNVANPLADNLNLRGGAGSVRVQSDRFFTAWGPLGIDIESWNGTVALIGADITLTANGVTAGITLSGLLVQLASTLPADEDTHDIRAFGVSIPRGRRGHVQSTANSAAIGAETVVLTMPSRTYYAGRAYECRMTGGVMGSVANTAGHFRLRKTDVLGQDLGEYLRYSAQLSATPYQANGAGRIFTVGASNVVAAIALTLGGVGGNATHWGSVASPRMLDITDVGRASDFVGTPVLV